MTPNARPGLDRLHAGDVGGVKSQARPDAVTTSAKSTSPNPLFEPTSNRTPEDSASRAAPATINDRPP
jgi:hypothetical protein